MTTATTITELRSTLLQVPWRGDPPPAGILAAPKRDLYVLEIETQRWVNRPARLWIVGGFGCCASG